MKIFSKQINVRNWFSECLNIFIIKLKLNRHIFTFNILFQTVSLNWNIKIQIRSKPYISIFQRYSWFGLLIEKRYIYILLYFLLMFSPLLDLLIYLKDTFLATSSNEVHLNEILMWSLRWIISLKSKAWKESLLTDWSIFKNKNKKTGFTKI